MSFLPAISRPHFPTISKPSMADAIHWIKAHTPKASTVAIVALQAIALVGVAIASIYFPIATMAIGVGGYIAYRFYIEYAQKKLDQAFEKEIYTHRESYNQEHSRMLKSVRLMRSIAGSRHMAQFVSLALVVAFWRIKAPLVILGFGAAACIFALDYFDTKNSLKKLEAQVYRRIFNNPALNAQENIAIRELYPDDDEDQIAQKLEIEKDSRKLRIQYQDRVDNYTAEAYAHLLNVGKCTPEQGAEDPEIIMPLGQLSVVYELESYDNNKKFLRSPILRPHLQAIQQAKNNYGKLTSRQKKRIKQRIITSEAPPKCTKLEEQVYLQICERWRKQISEESFFAGAEKHYLKKFKLVRYVKSRLEDYISLLRSPGNPRKF